MLILFTGYKEDKMPLDNKALAMRLCYLYADQFRMAGNVHQLFEFEKLFARMKIEDQLNFLIDHEELSETEYIETYKKIKIELKKGKHVALDRSVIATRKKLEEMVKQAFDNRLWYFLKPLRQSGILDLENLLTKAIFQYYTIDQRSPEQKTDKEGSLLSDIMQLDLDEEDLLHPIFLFLGDDVFKDEFTGQLPHTIPVDGYSTNGFLVELLTLANYNNFSLAQMDALRNNLLASLKPFRETAGKFATITADTEMAYNYCKAVVVPAAAALQQAHDADKTICMLDTASHGELLKIKLYAGMLPANMVYQYFKHIEVLTPKTEKLLVEAGAYNKMIPVLVPGIPYRVNAPVATFETFETGNLPLKKSLILD